MYVIAFISRQINMRMMMMMMMTMMTQIHHLHLIKSCQNAGLFVRGTK